MTGAPVKSIRTKPEVTARSGSLWNRGNKEAGLAVYSLGPYGGVGTFSTFRKRGTSERRPMQEAADGPWGKGGCRSEPGEKEAERTSYHLGAGKLRHEVLSIAEGEGVKYKRRALTS